MIDGSKVITGDVLVNNAVPPQNTEVSLRVGPGASTPGGYAIKADKIQILAGATVASTIYTTSAPLNAGTITGTVKTGFSPPYGVIDQTFENRDWRSAPGIYPVATPEPLPSDPGTSGGPSFGNVLLQPGATSRWNPACMISGLCA